MAVDLDTPHAEPFFYLLINGIGIKEGTTAKQLYTFTRVPDWTPTSAQKFIPGLHIPGEWSQNADLWGGVATGNNLGLEIQDFPQLDGSDTHFWSQLFANQRWSSDSVSYPQTFVTETVRPVDTAMWLASDGGFKVGSTGTDAERTVFVGMETMRYARINREYLNFNDKDLPGGFRFDTPAMVGLTRALFPAIGDIALEHPVQSSGAAAQPIVTGIPRTFFGRTVGLYCGLRYPDGRWSAEVDSLRLFAGKIQNIEWVSDRSVWRLQCDDLLSFLDIKCCTYIGKRRHVWQAQAGIPAPTNNHAVAILNANAVAATDDVPDANTVTSAEYVESIIGHPNSFRVRIWLASGSLVMDKIELIPLTEGRVPLIAYVDERLTTAFTYWPMTCTTTGPQDSLQTKIRIAPSADGRAKLSLGKCVAMQLGFGDGTAVFGETLDLNSGVAAAWYSDAPPSGNSLWWQRGLVGNSPNHMEIPVSSAAWFHHRSDIGDGSAPAVLIGGKHLARYKAAEASAPILKGATWYVGEYDRLTYAGNVMSTDSADYGSNVWPRKGWGTSATLDEENAAEVRQVFAPNPEYSVMRLILRLMMSTGYGAYNIGEQILKSQFELQTVAHNGGYDIYPAGIGAAIPAGLIDAGSFIDVGQQFDGALLRRSYVFTEAFSLRDFIDAEAKLLGFNVVIVNGKITARLVPGLATSADVVATLDESNRDDEGERSSSSFSAKNVINALTVKFGFCMDDGAFLKTENISYPVSQAENRTIRAITMENKGLHGDLPAVADMLRQNLQLRQVLYGYPLWSLRRSYVFRLWTTLAPGQIVQVTDGTQPTAGVPDPNTGKLGLIGRYAAIASCSYNYRGGSGQVELLLLPIQNDRTKTSGTTLDVQYSRGDGGWDAGTERLYVFKQSYTTSPATDLDGMATGDLVRVTDGTSADAETAPTALVTVTSVFIDPGGDSSYIGLADQDLDALLPGGFVVGHRYSVIQDPLAAYEPVDTSWYFRDSLASGSNYGSMTKNDNSGLTPTMTTTGWTVGTEPPGERSPLKYATEQIASTFVLVAPVVAPPSNSAANAWRSSTVFTGTIPAGDWTLDLWVKAVTAGGAMDGGIVYRLYKGTSADGTGATEITAGGQACSTVTNLGTGTEQRCTSTIALGAVAFASEYLFVSMAWLLTGAGGGATHDCLIEIGNPSGIWTRLRAPALVATTTTLTGTYIADTDTSQVSPNTLLQSTIDWDPFT